MIKKVFCNLVNQFSKRVIKIAITSSVMLFSFYFNSYCKTVTLSEKYLNVTIINKAAKINDTLTLAISDVLHNSAGHYNFGTYDAIGRDGVFRFRIPVNKNCGYFDLMQNTTFTKSIGASKFLLLSSYFWECNDSLNIQLTSKETYAGIYSKCYFSGVGSNKYELKRLCDSIMDNAKIKNPKPIFDSAFNYNDFYLIRCQKALNLLEEKRETVSRFSYEILKADLIYGNPASRFQAIFQYFNKLIKKGSEDQKIKFRATFKKLTYENDFYNIPEDALASSKNYLFYNFFRLKTLELVNQDTLSQSNIFSNLKERFHGAVLDKEVLILFLHTKASSSSFILYADAKKFVRDSTCLRILNELLKSGQGQTFANFILENQSGKFIKYSDLKGKVILIDFWFNGCGGCATFYRNTLKTIEDKYKSYKQIAFVSINGDNNKSRWLAGINQKNYTSNNAINLYTNGKGFLHPVIKLNNITTFPFVVLIDKNGVVRNLNSSNLYNYEGLNNAIQMLL